MKNILFSLLFIGGFGAYSLYAVNQSHADAAPATLAQNIASADTSIASTNTATAQSVSAPPVSRPIIPVPPAAPKPRGQYIDGSYTGSVADAYYGNVQVRATVAGGKLTKVTFLQYPNDRSTSVSINRQATPLLAQEAIQAQSAKVDGVSGASDTSAAFVQSLASALAKAKA
jgi:uncharacterized protein with FMN-binding domain